MYNQPYFIPGYYSGMTTPMAAPSMMRGAMGMGSALRGASAGARAAVGASRGAGLFSRLGSSFSAIKGINWGGLINNASKTLGVINQTIPLVRQVGPMVNNMKSMLKVASLFKDETDKQPRSRSVNTQNISSRNYNSSSENNSRMQTGQPRTNTGENNRDATQERYTTYEEFDSSPTFFIAS